VNVRRWLAVADAEALQQEAVRRILAAAAQAITARGRFLLVLAGGTTPVGVYALLAKADSDWPRWQIYFGDERCLPPDDAARNSRMAAATWLSQVPIPASAVHVMPAERGAVAAAHAYSDTLEAVGDFDLVLLGLGEDGHTASLFPGRDWSGAAAADVLAICDAPKPPAQRVSLSAARLSRARAVLFLVTGITKRQAVLQWHAGADIPARAIQPAAGVDVLIESALLPDGMT